MWFSLLDIDLFRRDRLSTTSIDTKSPRNCTYPRSSLQEWFFGIRICCYIYTSKYIICVSIDHFCITIVLLYSEYSRRIKERWYSAASYAVGCVILATWNSHSRSMGIVRMSGVRRGLSCSSFFVAGPSWLARFWSSNQRCCRFQIWVADWPSSSSALILLLIRVEPHSCCGDKLTLFASNLAPKRDWLRFEKRHPPRFGTKGSGAAAYNCHQLS